MIQIITNLDYVHAKNMKGNLRPDYPHGIAETTFVQYKLAYLLPSFCFGGHFTVP